MRRGDMRFQDEAPEMAVAVYTVGAAGTVALALSATGLYAVLSYLVALRRREIGVRLAIGAPPSRIITLVIRQALNLMLAGMPCGLTLAVPMAFAMQATFVAKVTATDPMVFANDPGAARRCRSRPPSPPFVHLEPIRSPLCGRNRGSHSRGRAGGSDLSLAREIDVHASILLSAESQFISALRMLPVQKVPDMTVLRPATSCWSRRRFCMESVPVQHGSPAG
jgi:ABC-type antimicrobial peptide transport system permease subunit